MNQQSQQDSIQARTIFNKTKRFVWYKFGIGMFTLLLTVGIGVAAFFIANSMSPMSEFDFVDGELQGSVGPWIGAFIIWLVLSSLITLIINIFWRFRVRCAHVAVVTDATIGNQLPEGGLVKHGMKRVKDRMGALGVLGFFVICRLVRSAAGQVGMMMQRGTGWLLGRAGTIGSVVSQGMGKMAKITIKSTTEVSMAWMFHRNDLRPIRAITNGMGLYFRNWQTMLKAAFGTTIVKMIVYFAFGILAAVMVLIAVLTMNFFFVIGAIAFLMIASSIKTAFLDSYRMCRMVNDYMKVAPQSSIDNQQMNSMRGCIKYRILENRAEAEDRKHGVTNPPPQTPATPRPKKQPAPKFDPQTGKPIGPAPPRFDPQTGQPLN